MFRMINPRTNSLDLRKFRLARGQVKRPHALCHESVLSFAEVALAVVKDFAFFGQEIGGSNNPPAQLHF